VQADVDVRGTGGSEGQWQTLGPVEQADYAEVARWAVGLPYSDGRLALYGYSYMGINQFLTAASRPPGLKALFAGIPGYDLYRDTVFHGGDVNSAFFTYYTPLVHFAGLFTNGWPQPGLLQFSKSPLTSLQILLQHVLGNVQPAFGDLLEGAAGGDIAFDGPFWEVRSPKSVLDRVDVPTFVLSGWRDLFQRGAPLLYENLDLPAGQKQLLMGPWYHLTTGLDKVGGPGEPPKLEELALAWFDHWVKGADNGIEDYGPVTSYQLGADSWETYQDFPEADVDYRRYYLNGQRAGSALSLNDGSLSASPPAGPGSDRWLAFQLNGICSLSTNQWSAGLTALIPVVGKLCESDNHLNELLSLTYTSPPVGEATHIAGPISLTLHGSTTARDAGWTATLSDVYPGGRSVPLTSGWLTSSRREVD
jgi:putative CocE/NonD family hydrolase